MEKTITLKCNYCGKLVELPHDTFWTEDNFVCDECMEYHYGVCADCGALYPLDEMVYVDSIDDLVCEDCLEENFRLCDHCDTFHRSYNTQYVQSTDSTVCDSCFEDLYGVCTHCGNAYLLDDLETDDDGDLACNECNIGNLIMPYHTKVPTVFYGEDKFYLGVELEVDDGQYKNNLTARYTKSLFEDGFIRFEHDGSLHMGYENITQPASLEYHIANMNNYKAMFKNLMAYDYKSRSTDTCGLHIHFSRNYFAGNEDECVAKLLLMFDMFDRELLKFSRRSEYEMERWATPYDINIGKILKYMKHHMLSRYQNVNLTNEETIEIRIFKGTMSIQTLQASLELVYTMATYSKEKSFMDIINLSWDDIINSTPMMRRYWDGLTSRY